MRSLYKWFWLTFVCGCVNTGAYLACSSFASHVTGFATLFGMNVGARNWDAAVAALTVPVSFMLGCMFSAWMVDRRIQQGRNPLYALPVFISACLLVLAAVLGHRGMFGPFFEPLKMTEVYLLLVLLCAACGMQNAVTTAATGAILRSSHLTGPLTDLSTGLVRCRLMPAGSVERKLEVRLLRVRAGGVASFVAGAVAGAFIFDRWQYLGLLAPAVLTLGVAAILWVEARR